MADPAQSLVLGTISRFRASGVQLTKQDILRAREVLGTDNILRGGSERSLRAQRRTALAASGTTPVRTASRKRAARAAPQTSSPQDETQPPDSSPPLQPSPNEQAQLPTEAIVPPDMPSPPAPTREEPIAQQDADAAAADEHAPAHTRAPVRYSTRELFVNFAATTFFAWGIAGSVAQNGAIDTIGMDFVWACCAAMLIFFATVSQAPASAVACLVFPILMVWLCIVQLDLLDKNRIMAPIFERVRAGEALSTDELRLLEEYAPSQSPEGILLKLAETYLPLLRVALSSVFSGLVFANGRVWFSDWNLRRRRRDDDDPGQAEDGERRTRRRIAGGGDDVRSVAGQVFDKYEVGAVKKEFSVVRMCEGDDARNVSCELLAYVFAGHRTVQTYQGGGGAASALATNVSVAALALTIFAGFSGV